MGFRIRKPIIACLYQTGELPRKLRISAWGRVFVMAVLPMPAESVMFTVLRYPIMAVGNDRNMAGLRTLRTKCGLA
jgi:hypothetical protein